MNKSLADIQQLRGNERSRTVCDSNPIISNFDRSLTFSKPKPEYQDLDSISGDLSTTDPQSLENHSFSATVVEDQRKLFNKLKKEQEDSDIINCNDNIFKQTLDDKSLKLLSSKTQCGVCQSDFSLVRLKHQCKFCGSTVCDKHSQKKRGDPQDTSKFYRICDICEDKYIKLRVQETYITKRDALNTQLAELEKQSEAICTQVKAKQQKIQTDKDEVQKKQNEYSTKSAELSFNISKVNQDNTNIKKEISNIDDKTSLIDQQIGEIIMRKGEKEQLIQQRVQDEHQMVNKILAVEQDIRQLQLTIEQINQKLLEKKMAEEKRKQLNEEVANTAELVNTDGSTLIQTKESSEGFQPKPKKAVVKIDETLETNFCQKCTIY